MKAIVTGATGFIGTALCEELLKEGHDVIAIIRPVSAKRSKIMKLYQNNPQYQSRLKIIEITLNQLNILAELEGVQADVFFHLAWNGSSGSDREDFELQYSNIRYIAEAIRVAKLCGCKTFIGAGSQAEYGVVHGPAAEGEVVPNPFMMYGAAKEAAYQMGRLVAKQVDIRFVWARIYSVYGVGENPGSLVNYVIQSLKAGKVPELTFCENMWNYIYITDCTNALRRIAETEDIDGIIHIASDETRPLKEYVEEIRNIVAPGMEIGYGKRISDEERTFCLNPICQKMKKNKIFCKILFRDGIKLKIETESK